MQQRDDLQGLRAVAITSVLLFHFFPERFPNGFLGVDIFFVISGYLISSILHKAACKDGMTLDTLFAFYWKRIRRILPLHLLYCLAAILLFALLAESFQLQQFKKSAIFALPLLANVKSLVEKEDYFEKVLDNDLFTHIWSLSVEVQFYFIAPALLGGFTGRPLLRGALLLIICSLSFAEFAISPALHAFNLMPARLWQFCAAAILVPSHVTEEYKQVPSTDKEKLIFTLESSCEAAGDDQVDCSSQLPITTTRRKWPTELICVLTSCTLVLVALCPFTLPSTLARLIATAAAAGVIHCGADAAVAKWLRLRSVVFLGDISYSLYIVHWPFAVCAADLHAHSLLQVRLAGIALSLGVAIVVYAMFERRYRKWTHGQIAVCCALLALLSSVALIASTFINDCVHYSADVNFDDALKRNIEVYAEPFKHLMIPDCAYFDFRNISSSTKFKNAISAPFGACNFPNRDGRLRFAVIGNSYAAGHARLIYHQFRGFFSSFQLFTEAGCEVLSYTTAEQSACHHLVNFTDVLDDFKPDVTFLVQRYYRIEEEPKSGESDEVYDEMKQHLDTIRNKSSLFLIADAMPSAKTQQIGEQLIPMARRNATADEINEFLGVREEKPWAAARTQRLVKECENCVLYDLKPYLRDSHGRFEAFEARTRLALTEQFSHLTDRGRERVKPAYAELARKQSTRLRQLERELYDHAVQ